MDPEWQAFFFVVAIGLWLLCAFREQRQSLRQITGTQLIAIGWACFAFPFAWDAISNGW